jgi:tripartite-type tricarboxylate transporter receptor subunit TctC
VGTVGHIGMELLKAKAGINPVHVPYPGNPQVINAIIGGQIQLSLLPPGLAAAQARAGKLRGSASHPVDAAPLVPEYPSLAEAGVKDFNLEIWNAVAARRSLPKPSGGAPVGAVQRNRPRARKCARSCFSRVGR